MKCSEFYKLKNEGFSGTEQQNIHNWNQTFYIFVVNVFFNKSCTLPSMTYNTVYKTSTTEIYFKVRNQTLPKHAEVPLNLWTERSNSSQKYYLLTTSNGRLQDSGLLNWSGLHCWSCTSLLQKGLYIYIYIWLWSVALWCEHLWWITYRTVFDRVRKYFHLAKVQRLRQQKWTSKNPKPKWQSFRP